MPLFLKLDERAALDAIFNVVIGMNIQRIFQGCIHLCKANFKRFYRFSAAPVRQKLLGHIVTATAMIACCYKQITVSGCAYCDSQPYPSYPPNQGKTYAFNSDCISKTLERSGN